MENRPPKHMREPADTVQSDNRIALEAGIRLRQAVELAGGPSHVSRVSGVHLRSLNDYLKGREMRQGVLIALADACGVSIEWLTTGRGHMLTEAQRKLLSTRMYEPSADGTYAVRTAEFERLIEEHPDLAPKTPPYQAPGDSPDADPEDPPETAGAHNAPPPTKAPSLFATLDFDRYALCFDLIQSSFNRMNLVPQPRRLFQLAALLYDAMEDGTFATSGVDDLVTSKDN
jgi:hypothetical protein